MKKFLCLFAVLLLFVCSSFARELNDFLNYTQNRSADFKTQQAQYYKNSLKQTETEKEKAFQKLYKSYVAYYTDVMQYYNNHFGSDLNYEYVKKHEKEYLSCGVGFNVPEGTWGIEEDFTMLLNTDGIPQNWFDWLTLQEKYIFKHRKICKKAFLKNGEMCVGSTMTASEKEQAIADLGKIEEKSDVIASIKTQDYNFIPYTVNDLLHSYLLGNELQPIFCWNKNGQLKLQKESKKSFEHFLKHHKDSKYWTLVNEYYEKLKQDNFTDTHKATDWLFDELEKIK